MMARTCVLIFAVLCTTMAHAQVYRWDNGQVIPGTEGITLGPGVKLDHRQLDFAQLSWFDLSASDFSFSDLTSATFESGNLTNSNFEGAMLRGAFLRSAMLGGATFSHATLTNANLSDANLVNANFKYADLSNAVLGGEKKNANFTNAILVGAAIGGMVSGANFTDAEVTRAFFSGQFTIGQLTKEQLYVTASYQARNLRGIRFSAMDLDGWNLSGQDLTDANLSIAFRTPASTLVSANLSRANLTNAILGLVSLRDADFTDAILMGTHLTDTTSRGFSKEQLYSTASYKSKDLRSIDMGPNDLSGWNFAEQNLEGADFGSADFTNAALNDSNLAHANFDSSTLTNTNLSGAVVMGANFRFSGLSKEQLYSTASYQAKYLTGIKLWRNDLNGWDFHDQNLANAFLDSSTLTNTNLGGAVVTGASLEDTTSRGFTKEQLYATASYQVKNLRGIKLAGNDLSGWDFSGQNLANALVNRSILTNATFAGANLANAYLDGSTFADADLVAADIRGALGLDLTGATSDNAILPDGTIEGLNLGRGDQLIVRNYRGKPDVGLEPTAISIRGAMTMTDGGSLHLLFESDPWDSLISFEPGIPVQLGGTLELTFTDDTQLATQSGRTIKAFDWTGVTPQGQFTVQGQPGMAWDTSKVYTTGEVTLLGISSDLNADKDVDSEDLTGFLENWTGSEYPAADKTWRDSDSDEDGDIDSADLLVFLSQWTGAAASEDSRVASVPEPSGVLLLGLALAGLMTNLRRRDGRR